MTAQNDYSDAAKITVEFRSGNKAPERETFGQKKADRDVRIFQRMRCETPRASTDNVMLFKLAAAEYLKDVNARVYITLGKSGA
jgi:hypothetical protein